MELKFKELVPGAILPNGKHNDICSIFPVVIRSQDYAVIRTGIAAIVPEGFELHIISKRKIAEKHQVVVMNAPGIIHANYNSGEEEEILVILINNSVVPFGIETGAPIAQLSLVPVIKFNPTFV